MVNSMHKALLLVLLQHDDVNLLERLSGAASLYTLNEWYAFVNVIGQIVGFSLSLARLFGIACHALV